MRLVSVAFVHAPTPDKPRKGADVAIQAAYVAAAKEANLVALARQRRAGVRIPQTRHSVRSFSAQFARRSGGPARLWAMGFASAPTAWRIAGRKNVENTRPTTGVY